MSDIFDRLEKAPKGTFVDVTAMRPEVPLAGQPDEIQQPGVVADAVGIEGGKAAELKPFGTGSAQGTTTDTQGQNAAPKQTLGHLLTARTAIGIVDSILPAIAVIAFQYFMGVKIPKKDIQLNEQERAIIQIPLQNYLNSIPIDFDSPLMALLITIGAVYGSKFAEKGFNAYFEKRDADAMRAEEIAKMKKQLQMETVKEQPKPDLADLKAGEKNKPPVNVGEGVDMYGHSLQERQKARADFKARGKQPPNSKVLAAYINRNKIQSPQ